MVPWSLSFCSAVRSSPANASGILLDGNFTGLVSPVSISCSIRWVRPKSLSSLENMCWNRINKARMAAFSSSVLWVVDLSYKSCMCVGISSSGKSFTNWRRITITSLLTLSLKQGVWSPNAVSLQHDGGSSFSHEIGSEAGSNTSEVLPTTSLSLLLVKVDWVHDDSATAQWVPTQSSSWVPLWTTQVPSSRGRVLLVAITE